MCRDSYVSFSFIGQIHLENSFEFVSNMNMVLKVIDSNVLFVC